MSSQVGSRATEDRGVLGKGQPLGPEVQESEEEVEDSKSSPGNLIPVKKNRWSGTYHWLLYNFTVNEYTLKNEHKKRLREILGEIRKYGKNYGSASQIVLAGHASPSGTYKRNKNLALQRAAQVKKWLTQQIGISADWFADVNTSEVWSVVKGRPRTPKQRKLSRAVSIVLPLMIDRKKPSSFPTSLRTQTRAKISAKRDGEEELFCYWVIDNWRYLTANKYCWEAYPRKDGLFFNPPGKPLRTVREAFSFLRQLYKKFQAARYRLKSEYTGKPGTFFLPNPVTAYQQMARWIYLDSNARAGTEKLDHFFPIVAVKRDFATLIGWVNRGKFGKPGEIWKKIENYFKAKGLPMRVAK